jgi:hypothetical protein
MSRFQGISCSVLRDTLSKLIWGDVLWVIEAERQIYQEGKEERDVMRKFDTAGTALCTIMAGLSGRKWTGLLIQSQRNAMLQINTRNIIPHTLC